MIIFSDAKALRGMKKASGAENPDVFLRLPDKHRAGTLARTRKAGASLNRVIWLTGTGTAIARRAVSA